MRYDKYAFYVPVAFRVPSHNIKMSKKVTMEAATLRVLSGFYRNDMALFSRHAADRFLFAVPECESGEQTALSIRNLSLFPDPNIRHAIRKADASVFFQSNSVCSVLLTYTLDIYRKEIPVAQKNLRLLICWHNISPDTEEPAWRIIIFQISDRDHRPGDLHSSLITGSPLSVPRDSIVSEPRLSYAPFRKNLVRIKDREHAIHVLQQDDIIWVESDHMHSIVHTHSGTIRAIATLSQLANDALSYLYRPHISYLINPRYLYRISQLQLVLTDGAVIPVPERKFAQVKRDLSHAVL